MEEAAISQYTIVLIYWHRRFNNLNPQALYNCTLYPWQNTAAVIVNKSQQKESERKLYYCFNSILE